MGQDDVEVEAVVVDDASEDDTPAYLASLGEPRVSVVRHDSPRGVSAARNAGVAGTRARWVAFLDDDDLWAPDKLRAQLHGLAANPGSGWSCVAAVDVDEELRVVEPQVDPPRGGRELPRLLAVNVIPGGGSGVVAETSLVRSVGGFDEELRILADWDLWIRLALRSPLTPVDRPLVAYQRHEGAMTTGMPAIRAELERVEAKYAAERAAHGVELAWAAWLPYIALMQRRAGLRMAPAAQYARLAVIGRNPLWLLRAAAALARPQGIERLRRRGRRRLAPDRRSEVERWLAPVRAGISVR